MASPNNQNPDVSLAPELLELHRVLDSPQFSGAGRLGPFLRHLVERTLSGETNRLKESVLGIEFFARGDGFDPRLDPIVRVEARRLRARLEKHYLETPRSGNLRIELPRGTYVPIFVQPETTAPGPEPGADPNRSVKLKYAGLAIFAVAAIAFLSWRFSRPAPAVPISICIVPFAASSGEEELALGISEELIDALSRFPSLRVVSRGIAIQYSGRGRDPREVGRQTGANNVLDGSLRRSGDRLQVTVRLIDSKTGYQRWSSSFDAAPAGLFELERQVANSIAAALGAPNTPRRGPALSPRYTANLQVYQLYLKARSLMNSYTRGAALRALDLLEQAERIDPGYAPAQALGATLYAILGYYDLPPGGDSWNQAEAWAARALLADSNLAESHAAKGFILAWHRRDWLAATREFDRAMELDPDSVDAHLFRAVALELPRARFAEASALFRKALELDPANTLANYTSGFCLLAERRDTEAIAQYEKALELKSDLGDLWSDYATALAFAGRKEDARKAFRRSAAVESGPVSPPGILELELTGDHAAALRLARQRLSGEKSMNRARELAVVGLTEEALDSIAKAIARGESEALWLRIDPRLESLRKSPRYAEYVRQLNLI